MDPCLYPRRKIYRRRAAPTPMDAGRSRRKGLEGPLSDSKMTRAPTILLLTFLLSFKGARPQDAPYTIRILCLYGSVPAKGYWKVEPFHGPHNMINWVAK